jgi:hypothetical protein
MRGVITARSPDKKDDSATHMPKLFNPSSP